MKEIFGIEPRMYYQEKRKFEEKSKWGGRITDLSQIPKGHNVGVFYPKMCSKILYVLLGKFAEGKHKKITAQIKDCNIRFKKGLIRAFFDDEGSIRADSYTARFHQDDKELLENIRTLICEVGINSHEIKNYIKKNKSRYYFNISGFKEYYLFYYLIGCTSSKKRMEFEKLINKVGNSKSFKKKYALPLPTSDNPSSWTVFSDKAF